MKITTLFALYSQKAWLIEHLHERSWWTNWTITIFGTFFQTTSPSFTQQQKFDVHLHGDPWIYISSIFLFVRHYSGYLNWFPFLRLVICLNSARGHTWTRIKSKSDNAPPDCVKYCKIWNTLIYQSSSHLRERAWNVECPLLSSSCKWHRVKYARG